MTSTELFEKKFQTRLRAIKSGQQICQMSATTLKSLTCDFEESYVRRLIAKNKEPREQLLILNAIEKAFDEKYFMGVNARGEAIYDIDKPEYFEEYRVDLELDLPISDTMSDIPDGNLLADDLPSQASDTKFEDLCRSLVEQRIQFKTICDRMLSLSDKTDIVDSIHKKLSAMQKDYEMKSKECDEMREKMKGMQVQLKEAQKMNTKLAKKSDAQVLEKFINQHLSQSKRKSVQKREYIKTVFLDMVRENRLELTTELQEKLDNFDNETLLLLLEDEQGSQPSQSIPEPVGLPPRSIPACLDTEEAHLLWAKAKAHEWVDDELMPLISQKKAAILASVMSDILGLKPRWQTFEDLWQIEDLATKLSQAQQNLYYADTLQEMSKTLELKN